MRFFFVKNFKITTNNIMELNYLLIVILVLCWTLNPFLKKKSVGDLSSNEYIIFNHCFVSIFLALYFLYLVYNGECDILQKIKNKNTKELLYSFFAAIVTVISSVVLINLLKKENASYLIPHIQPVVILLTFILGYFIFNEKINFKQIMGGLLIVLGLFIINKNKDK